MDVRLLWCTAVLYHANALLNFTYYRPELLQHPVDFYLHDRGYPRGIQLADGNLHLLRPYRETKFIVHGFMESREQPYFKRMTQEYLKRGDYNVIQVDWSTDARSIYKLASTRTQYVGQRCGNFIASLVLDYHLPLENIHIVGHSLGAHVAGHAGKMVYARTGQKINRITALDPARPLFEGVYHMRSGLASSDAEIVDAIHTDAGVFGMIQPVGTADFYPNGGSRPQPFCRVKQEDLVFENMTEYIETIFCSHRKSFFYFTESINNVLYVGTSCTSYSSYQRGACEGNTLALMGEDYHDWPGATGGFYLKTNYQN